MRKHHGIWSFVVLVLALSAAGAQDNSARPPADVAQDSAPPPQQPVPAFGPDQSVPAVSENPPISGVDMPNLEPHAAPLSYLQAGAHLSESVDSNVEDTLGGSATHSVSRALGSLELQRLWSHYDLSLDYLGGVGYYNARGVGLKQIEELGVYQKVTWKRGEFGVRDAFSYQPEGSFGSAYGAVGTTGAGLSGLSAFFGGTALGALGQVPRIMNISLVDVVETLTPKSSITATAGYGFLHFLGNEPGTENAFIGSSQVSAEVGYSRVLGPHDQGAIVYGYQGFNFSTGVTFHSNVIQLMWGHRISGRMDFLVAAGPQFLEIDNLTTYSGSSTGSDCTALIAGIFYQCLTNDLRLSAAGRAQLRYRFPKVSMDLSYAHFLTSGSGFFAGSESNIASLSASRPVGRIWTVISDLGYAHNTRVLPLSAAQSTACQTATSPQCSGVSANTDQYGFAGVSVHRLFGRNFNVFASYQFNYLAFDGSYCGTTGPCNRISQRSIGTIGLDWTPRPMRLD